MSRIRNVVIACDYAYVEGGAAKVAIQTAVLLSRLTDYKVYFIGGCGEACQELKDSKVTCVLLGLPDLMQNPSKKDAFIHGIYNKTVYEETKRLFQTLNPSETVLHVHTWTKVLTSAVFKAAADCGIRIFLTLHDYFITCPNGGCYNYVQRRICELQPMSPKCIRCNCDSRNYVYKLWRVLRQAKQNSVLSKLAINYIFISAFQREQLAKRIGSLGRRRRWRLRWLPGSTDPLVTGSTLDHRGEGPSGAFVDVPVIHFYVRNPIPVGERYRIQAENNDLFLFVGRITQEKGADLFCEAVTRAGVKAAALGDGPMLEELKQKYSNIEFPGWQTAEQVQAWKNKARGYIFSSVWFEGSPLTVPEMQAFGVPCIVTECNSAKDTVVDGKNGYIVKPDVDEIVQAIREFEDDETVKEMSVATFESFDKEAASPEAYIKNLTEVYEKG